MMTIRLLLALCLCIPAVAQDAPHVVFLVGDAEYRSELTMPALADRLEESFGYKTTVIQDAEITSSNENRMPGIEVLKDADLLVIFTRFRRWPQEDLDSLSAYVARGGPIVGFRTSTHAFNYGKDDPRHRWNAFGQQILGAPWIFHYGHQSSTDARVRNRVAAPALLLGVPDNFQVRSWTYHVRPNHPPVGAHVLVDGTPIFPGKRKAKSEEVNPVAWTMSSPGGGRVFMTTMGHPEDFRVGAFRRLIGNGVQWALGRAIEDRELADFPKVTHPDDADGVGEPEKEKPWLAMNYGPFLSCVVGIPGEGTPRPETVVHKGIVQRLRFPDGEESELMAVFDTDLLRWRCVWRGELALRGIVFDGPHGTFPEIDGDPLFIAGPQPGPIANEGVTTPRDEPYGPIDQQLGRWRCLSLSGSHLRFEYEASAAKLRERIFALESGFVREIESSGPALKLRLLDVAPKEDWELVVSGGTVHHDGQHLQIPANGKARVALLPKDSVSSSDLRALKLPSMDQEAESLWGAPQVLEGKIDVRPETAGRSLEVSVPAGEKVNLSLLPGDDRAAVLQPFDQKRKVEPNTLITGEGFLLRCLGNPAHLPLRARVLGTWHCDAGEGSYERNVVSGKDDLQLQGVTWRRGVEGRSLDFDGTAVAWLNEAQIDLKTGGLTVAAWIQTTSDGTVFALAPKEGKWARNGLSLFIKDGQLCVDVGWVGAVSSGTNVADGSWHHVALSFGEGGEGVRLFVDGRKVGDGSLPLINEKTPDFIARFGRTNDDFPQTTHFSGYMDELVIVKRALSADAVAAVAGESLVEAIVLHDPPPSSRFQRLEDGSIHLIAEAPEKAATVKMERLRGDVQRVIAWASKGQSSDASLRRPFRIDRLSWPIKNPHKSWMRFGAFDFLPNAQGNPQSAALTTWSGDVWRVDGLDETLSALRWTRIATGLHQPFGILAEDEGVLVLGRDQITRLVDSNGDGETDRYQVHSNAPRNSQQFHEPASGLIRDKSGNLLWVKAARHAKLGLHDHHGSILRLSENGHDYDVLARGLRAPVGLTPLPDGSLLTTDQEGHWMPANRINIVRPSKTKPPFLGNGWASGGSQEREERGGEQVYSPWSQVRERTTPPLCWLHPKFDRSPATLEYINHKAWGPLSGSIFGLSYGTGELYLVLRDDVPLPDGSVMSQGGTVKLGVQLPTGILDARVHPATGDLYCCGLFGWSSDRTDPGGFFRIRPNPKAFTQLDVPTHVRAYEDGLEMRFLRRPTSLRPADWTVEAWNYLPSSRYGSPDISLKGKKGKRSRFQIDSIRIVDSNTVFVQLKDFRPAMQVEVTWGTNRRAHLSVHTLRNR